MADTETEDLTSLGGWTGADLGATARTYAGIGADADLPPEVRFLSGVAKLVRRRRAEKGVENDPVRPAVFLLEPNAPAHKPDARPQRVPMLDNGLTAVTGRLWFLSAVVVSGKYVDLDDVDDAALFTFVTDDLKLGNVPAVIFDPRTTVPSVRFYPSGLADAEKVETVRVTESDVTLTRIFEVIDRLHATCLVTPEGQARAGKLWENHEKWWPSSKAEDVLQLYLRVGLTTAFPTCTVREEQTDIPGRLDLEIEESDALDRSQVTRHAILELKVLRAFRDSGAIVSEQLVLGWVLSGVQQAASYKIQRGAREAALCCFDMRKEHTGEQCFAHVRDLAKGLQVELRVWFIFATSGHYRAFMTANN